MLTQSSLLRTDNFIASHPARAAEDRRDVHRKPRSITNYRNELWYYDLQPVLMATD